MLLLSLSLSSSLIALRCLFFLFPRSFFTSLCMLCRVHRITLGWKKNDISTVNTKREREQESEFLFLLFCKSQTHTLKERTVFSPFLSPPSPPSPLCYYCRMRSFHLLRQTALRSRGDTTYCGATTTISMTNTAASAAAVLLFTLCVLPQHVAAEIWNDVAGTGFNLEVQPAADQASLFYEVPTVSEWAKAYWYLFLIFGILLVACLFAMVVSSVQWCRRVAHRKERVKARAEIGGMMRVMSASFGGSSARHIDEDASLTATSEEENDGENARGGLNDAVGADRTTRVEMRAGEQDTVHQNNEAEGGGGGGGEENTRAMARRAGRGSQRGSVDKSNPPPPTASGKGRRRAPSAK